MDTPSPRIRNWEERKDWNMDGWDGIWKEDMEEATRELSNIFLNASKFPSTAHGTDRCFLLSSSLFFVFPLLPAILAYLY